MISVWTILAFLFFPLCPAQARTEGHSAEAFFLIDVDPSVNAGDLQVSYFLSGEFGGFGGYDVKRVVDGKVLIHTQVEGKAATSLRAVLYAPHCRIQTIRVDDLQASHREGAFHCSPLGAIELRGKFNRGEITPDRRLEVEVRYLGFWAHTFFGIADGPVLTLHIGKATVAPDGSFRVALPNLREGADPVTQSQDEWFEILISETKTGNILAELKPPAALSQNGHLKIIESDPGDVNFQAKWRK
jgi:hypothetical protein